MEFQLRLDHATGRCIGREKYKFGVLSSACIELQRPANVRPQTTARGIGLLFGLEARTPFDRAPAWKELRGSVNGRRLQMLRDASFRQLLISEADVHGTGVDLEKLYVLPDGDARYDCDPANSLAESLYSPAPSRAFRTMAQSR